MPASVPVFIENDVSTQLRIYYERAQAALAGPIGLTHWGNTANYALSVLSRYCELTEKISSTAGIKKNQRAHANAVQSRLELVIRSEHHDMWVAYSAESNLTKKNKLYTAYETAKSASAAARAGMTLDAHKKLQMERHDAHLKAEAESNPAVATWLKAKQDADDANTAAVEAKATIRRAARQAVKAASA